MVIYIYFRIAPLQIDPHHDGIILGAAVAVANGHPILSGAFSQYGPLPPLIQGAVLWVFSTQLLALRYMTAIVCLLIGYSLYKLSKLFSTEILARTLSFTWLIASSIWITQFPGALLPWPSLISTLLVLNATILFINASKSLNTKNAIIAGIFFGLAGFCRIQASILLPLFALVWIIKNRTHSKTVWYAVGGYLFSIFLMALYLGFTGGLDDFLSQVIVTPLFEYSGLGRNNNYNRFQFSLYLIETIGFVILILSIKLIRRFINSRITELGFMTILLIVSHFVGIWISSLSIPIKFKVLFSEPLQNLAISPYYFASICSIFLILKQSFSKKDTDNQSSFGETLVAIVAVGSLIQLYPQPDIMHLWWVAPLFLPTILIIFSDLDTKTNKDYLAIFKSILVASIILGSITAIQFIARPWSEYKLEVLRGTYASEEKARSIDIFGAINRYAVTDQTSFDCPDGVYAVANGRYLPIDQWFVNWGYSKSEKPEVGTVRVICDHSKTYAESAAKRFSMSVEFYDSNQSGKSIAILRKEK